MPLQPAAAASHSRPESGGPCGSKSIGAPRDEQELPLVFADAALVAAVDPGSNSFHLITGELRKGLLSDCQIVKQCLLRRDRNIIPGAETCVGAITIQFPCLAIVGKKQFQLFL